MISCSSLERDAARDENASPNRRFRHPAHRDLELVHAWRTARSPSVPGGRTSSPVRACSSSFAPRPPPARTRPPGPRPPFRPPTSATGARRRRPRSHQSSSRQASGPSSLASASAPARRPPLRDSANASNSWPASAAERAPIQGWATVRATGGGSTLTTETSVITSASSDRGPPPELRLGQQLP